MIIMAPLKDSASIPTEATVNSWFNAVAAMKLVPYADKVSMSHSFQTSWPEGISAMRTK
jgi:hypothetical protein